MTDKSISEKDLRIQKFLKKREGYVWDPVYTSKTFNKLNNETKKEVLLRLRRLSEEFDNKSGQELFSSSFLNYQANVSSLINILVEVNQEELQKVLLLLFDKVRESKEDEYIHAAAYFVNLLERIGYEGEDHADINDTILYGNLLDFRENINAETLNWEFTRLRAEYAYGINFVDIMSPTSRTPFDARTALGNFNYIVSYLSSNTFAFKEDKVRKDLNELKQELEDLDDLREARDCLKTNTKISRKGVSLLGGVKEATVENASVLGEIIQIDEPYTKANKKRGIKKNLYFEAKSAHQWLLNRKPGKYFQPLLDNRFPNNSQPETVLLTFSINNKEELDKFIKDNEESKKRITEYPLDTVFAINPNKNINKFKGIQKERLEWLGLDGKSLTTIVNTKNPYHEHERIRSPYTHIGYDLNQGRVVIKEEES
ncbi:hypothetical protein OAK06_03555 [Gammaproteobacteria bacterium]|nr:hypothetical protein [Gammaproteobacteria bacterium]